MRIYVAHSRSFDYLLHKRGVKVASSLKTISDNFVEYDDVEEMISGIERVVEIRNSFLN